MSCVDVERHSDRYDPSRAAWMPGAPAFTKHVARADLHPQLSVGILSPATRGVNRRYGQHACTLVAYKSSMKDAPRRVPRDPWAEIERGCRCRVDRDGNLRRLPWRVFR